ncbi:MAG: BLUF domain-containing protein, partial [Pseudomonadota bacterium]
MVSNADLRADDQRVFRLTYVSRATGNFQPGSAVRLAGDAATNNRQNRVSGVLFSDNGVFLQWLEGPAEKVCSLMSRISSDSRHTDVSILNAGWLPERRYAGWPMQLAEHRLPHAASNDDATAQTAHPACDAQAAMEAFEAAAATYRQLENDLCSVTPLQNFAEQLLFGQEYLLPPLPRTAAEDLHARAQFV